MRVAFPLVLLEMVVSFTDPRFNKTLALLSRDDQRSQHQNQNESFTIESA